MEFRGFEPGLFQFLEELADNNNRPWFQENKGRYEREVLQPCLAFIHAFRPRLLKISEFFVASDRRVGGSLLRVYRDTRFSGRSEPYKTNAGIQFRHEGGADIHAPGFYVHVAPDECFLALGVWRPDSLSLRKIRQAIVEHCTVAPGKGRSPVPQALRAGRRVSEASSAGLPAGPSPGRGPEADGLPRLVRAERAGSARSRLP
jgi:uncharacterized protein (DUF2461 family)